MLHPRRTNRSKARCNPQAGRFDMWPSRWSFARNEPPGRRAAQPLGAGRGRLDGALSRADCASASVGGSASSESAVPLSHKPRFAIPATDEITCDRPSTECPLPVRNRGRRRKRAGGYVRRGDVSCFRWLNNSNATEPHRAQNVPSSQ